MSREEVQVMKDSHDTGIYVVDKDGYGVQILARDRDTDKERFFVYYCGSGDFMDGPNSKSVPKDVFIKAFVTTLDFLMEAECST